MQTTLPNTVPDGHVRIWCELGQHHWDRLSQRGRKPRNCPDHQPAPDERTTPVRTAPSASGNGSAPEPVSETVTLFCQLGQHEWERPRQRGKKPLNCPEHQPVKEPTEGRKTEGQRETTKDDVWASVARIMAETNCHCEPALVRGMTLSELRPIKSCKPNYMCMALDTYRRRLSA